MLYYPENDSQTTPNPVCIACKPKFKPTYSGQNAKSVDYSYVLSCDSIPNCLISTEYNKCQECDDKFVLLYDSEI